jgi:hypothetical protein
MLTRETPHNRPGEAAGESGHADPIAALLDTLIASATPAQVLVSTHPHIPGRKDFQIRAPSKEAVSEIITRLLVSAEASPGFGEASFNWPTRVRGGWFAQGYVYRQGVGR